MGQSKEEKQKILKFGDSRKVLLELALTSQRLRSFTQDMQVPRIGKQTVSAFAGRFFRNFEFRECSESTSDSGYGQFEIFCCRANLGQRMCLQVFVNGQA